MEAYLLEFWIVIRLLVAIPAMLFITFAAHAAEVTRVDTALDQLSVAVTPVESTLLSKDFSLKIRFKPKGQLWEVRVLSVEGKEALFQMKAKVAPLRKGLGFRMFDMSGQPLVPKETTGQADTDKSITEVVGKVVRLLKEKNRIVMMFSEAQVQYFADKKVGEKIAVVESTEKKERQLLNLSVYLIRNDRVVFDIDLDQMAKVKVGSAFRFPVDGIVVDEIFTIVSDEYINIGGPLNLFSNEPASANLRYATGSLQSSNTVEEADAEKSKTTPSHFYIDGAFKFGPIGGMRLKYLTTDFKVAQEDVDEVKLSESVLGLDMAFHVAGFAAGLAFESYSFNNNLVDSGVALSYNRTSIYLGYVGEGLNLYLGYLPKTNVTFTSKSDGERSTGTSDFSSKFVTGFHMDASSTLRLPVEFGWYVDDGTDDGIELKAAEKLNAMVGLTYGLDAISSFSVAFIRNRSVIIPEYIAEYNAGKDRSARTGLGLSYIFSGQLMRAGVGVEYYAGGTQRTQKATDAEGEPIEQEVIVEQTGIAAGFYVGINY